MLELFGNMANDKVNRYNERLTTGAIIDMLQNQWNDFVPMTVNHDRTKLIGFSRLFSVFIRGTTILTNQSFLPESKAEEKYLEATCGKQVIDNLCTTVKNSNLFKAVKENKVVKNFVETLGNRVKDFKKLPKPAKVILGVGTAIATLAVANKNHQGDMQAAKIDQKYEDKAKLQGLLG